MTDKERLEKELIATREIVDAMNQVRDAMDTAEDIAGRLCRKEGYGWQLGVVQSSALFVEACCEMIDRFKQHIEDELSKIDAKNS